MMCLLRHQDSRSHIPMRQQCQSRDKTILSPTPMGQKSFVANILKQNLGQNSFVPGCWSIRYIFLFLIWVISETNHQNTWQPPSSPPRQSQRSGTPPPSISRSRSRCSHSRPSRRRLRRSPPNGRGGLHRPSRRGGFHRSSRLPTTDSVTMIRSISSILHAIYRDTLGPRCCPSPSTTPSSAVEPAIVVAHVVVRRHQCHHCLPSTPTSSSPTLSSPTSSSPTSSSPMSSPT